MTVVVDACGSTSELCDRVTHDELRELGAVLTTTFGVLLQLYPDLSTSEEQRAAPVGGKCLSDGTHGRGGPMQPGPP